MDSLALPDSLVPGRSEADAWDLGFGASYSLPFRDTRVAAEFHTRRSTRDDTFAGAGPEGRAWSVRGGFDTRMTPVLRLQGGYGYESTDLDEETEQNEFLAHTVSAGMGLAPSGARWQIDAAYLVEIRRADFSDLDGRRGNGQRGLLRLSWKL